MNINIEKKDDTTIVHMTGSLDADTVSVFKKKTGELFDGGDHNFVLDLTKVDFIDSMGLGAMISLLRRAREKKGDVKVYGLTNEVKEIFEITRLNKLFEVAKNL